jgi:hypothetical protein
MKKAAALVGGLLIMGAVLFAVAAGLAGIRWLAIHLLPWLVPATAIAFAFCLLILLPMCIFRKTRSWAAIGFYLSSFVFGTCLWFFSVLVCEEIWGMKAVIFGLVFAGVGVLPIAFIASLFTANWPIFFSLVLWTVLTFGSRFLGVILAPKESHPEQDEGAFYAIGSE